MLVCETLLDPEPLLEDAVKWAIHAHYEAT
jgi:hypothetical protein